MGEDSKIYILEMNARFGGQYPFSHVAGANFPLQIIEWLKGFSTKQELITPKIGVIGCKDLTPVVLGGDFEFNNTVITCEE